MNTQNNFMDSLNNAISQSLLTRFLANVFGFVLLVACLIVGIIELLRGEPINPLVYGVLFTGLGFVMHALGLNQGVTLQAMKGPTPPKVPDPTVTP